MISVANKTPKASDTAIGIMNLACTLRSSNSGSSPKKVVNDVNRIGGSAPPLRR